MINSHSNSISTLSLSPLSKSAFNTTFNDRLNVRAMMPHSLGKPQRDNLPMNELFERASALMLSRKSTLSKDANDAAIAM